MADDITEHLLLCLENAVADGCSINAEMAKAIGWSESKFISVRYGKRVNGDDERTRTSNAIKKGEERRTENFLAIAENSLKKLLAGYEYEETSFVEEVSETKGTTTKTTKTKKVVKPDTTAVIFTLVNSSNGKWKSINSKESNDDSIPSNFEIDIR